MWPYVRSPRSRPYGATLNRQVSAAALTSQHYARKPVERRNKKLKPIPFARRPPPPAPAMVSAASVGLASEDVPSSPAAEEPNQAAGEEMRGGGHEPDLTTNEELPIVWRTKPRSAGRRGPRQITPPEDGSWFEFSARAAAL